MDRTQQNARARLMLNLVDLTYSEDKNNEHEIFENNELVESFHKNESSPLPPDANFTKDELSIIDHVDLEDSEHILEDLPSNASIFPDSILNTSPESVYSPSIIGNSRESSPIRIPVNGLKSKTSTTPIPSPAISFSSPNSPINISFSVPDNQSSDSSYIKDTDSAVSTPNQPSNRRKRSSNIKKDKGCLRELYKQEWKDSQRKYKVNRGLEYTSRNRKIHPEKQLKPPCPKSCRQKCYDRIPEENRKRIFKMFWRIGNHSRQWDFITKYVIKLPKARSTVSENSKRLYTIKYYLPCLESDENVETKRISVCKTMFLRTLSISFNFVYTALEKFDRGKGFVESDQRGKHVNHPKTITIDMVRSVIDHMEALAPVEAHYVRKDLKRKYLDGSLSFPKMYKLYEEWFDSNAYSSKASSVRQYRDIINKNINIALHKPKKDACEECHIFENKTQPTEEEIQHQRNHLKQKETAKKLKKEDKELAIQSKEVLACTFDLQKCLNVPHGNVSTFYYKRKLSTYNFTIFDMASLQGYCYSWHQQTAKRGANEVASSIYKFIEMTVSKGIKEYRFWSDNCGGQNRNRIVFLMYMYICNKFNINIIHRFLVVGHTQNEGDSMHALIERQTKDRIIYTPDQWYAAFQWAKTDGKPYNVTEMSQESILDFKRHLKHCINWTSTSDGTKMSWNKVCEIKIQERDPFKIIFKYNYEDDSVKWIDCRNKPKNTRNNQKEKVDLILGKAYENPLPIDKNKHKDLMDLCKSQVIPKEYHLFYNSLITGNTNNYESDSD